MNEIKIPYETTPEIQNIISNIGRTEDIKFSPDNKLFAITELYEKSVHVFSVEFVINSSTPRISISDYIHIFSKSMNNPHGLTFLDNNHLVVCNRWGDVSIFKIPSFSDKPEKHNIEPLETISGKGFLFAKVKTPGSVDSHKISDNRYRIFVCNNFWHMITSHTVEIGSSIRIENQGILIENGLKIPDGISISPDGKWIAITNHVDGNVLIYEHLPQLNRKTLPSNILRGAVCPHGIRFAPDGKNLFVADAATPYIHLFNCNDGNWGDLNKSAKSLQILEDEVFYRGRYGVKEGGLKGIDVDNSGSLLVSTHKDEVLAFYNLNKLSLRENEFSIEEKKGFCRERDASSLKDKIYEPNKKWTLKKRIKCSFENTYSRRLNIQKRIRIQKDLLFFDIRNKFSKETLLDPTGPIVSLTTHGFRIETVYYAIESIGAGSNKPSRIILWLNDEDRCLNPPKSLRRLMPRGLEICYSENYGPHTKYYSYIKTEDEINKPLVTADDDVLYAKDWLQKLIEVNKAQPSVIHCNAAHRISLNNMRFLPFSEWEPCTDTIPSFMNLILGVSGVIYPPDFLQYLKNKGDVFKYYCAKNDDIWLTVNALRSDFKIAQIKNRPKHYINIPGTQKQRLMDYNEALGGNQIQLAQTFTKEDMEKLDSYINEEG